MVHFIGTKCQKLYKIQERSQTAEWQQADLPKAKPRCARAAHSVIEFLDCKCLDAHASEGVHSAKISYLGFGPAQLHPRARIHERISRQNHVSKSNNVLRILTLRSLSAAHRANHVSIEEFAQNHGYNWDLQLLAISPI